MKQYFDQSPLLIGDLMVKTPIVQGGMGVGISLSGLASAVANEGGLGVISAAALGMVRKGNASVENNVAAVKEEIKKARERTTGVLGINIMVALSDFAETVKAAIEGKIDVIFSGAGLPLNLPSFLPENSKTKLVPIVSSGRAARVISRRWREKYHYIPDAFVLEGPLAGGHLGFCPEHIADPAFCLENLLQDVLKVTQSIEKETGHHIPVIPAGGIFSGADIKHFFQLGASAVQMGTRFVATEECDADKAFKEAYIHCTKEDIHIIQSPVGMPGRAIVNSFLREVKQGKKKPLCCSFHCIKTCKEQESPYCIFRALTSASKGNLKNGFAFVGANGYKVKKIISVKELFETLSQEYQNSDVC